jgi:hypothetical protein
MTASKDPFFRDLPQFIAPEAHMFTRRGAWMGLQADSPKYGKGSLYLMTNRGNRKGRYSHTFIPIFFY